MVMAMTMDTIVILLATATLAIISDPLDITTVAGGAIITDQDTDPIIDDKGMGQRVE